MNAKTLLVGLVLAPVLLGSCSAIAAPESAPRASAPSASVPPALTNLPTPTASSTPPAPAGAGSGVQGRTMVDGGCPIVIEQSPCAARPIASRITIVRVGSLETAAVVTSDAAGRFRVALPPGGYRLQPANLTGTPFPRGAAVEVTIRSGHYTDLTVWFDSGIQ